ncbi:hypothetical protein FACS1894111_11430 [Clostridia bacterium]|nr:hypothetical protein FACS1894111_11430 [Clostridia bacterium]
MENENGLSADRQDNTIECAETTDGRKRTIQVKFRITEQERDLILEKMRLLHTDNMAAYLRKMAIDDYIQNPAKTDDKIIVRNFT